MANAVTDSRTPRRFIAVSAMMITTAASASCPRMKVKADAASWTPEAARRRPGPASSGTRGRRTTTRSGGAADPARTKERPRPSTAPIPTSEAILNGSGQLSTESGRERRAGRVASSAGSSSLGRRGGKGTGEGSVGEAPVSAAGSSGGAAAALASGTAWLAHGSDMGGSLRNPASFCGIVGMRPSIGRVAHTPAAKIDRNLGVQGPMARNIEDLALMLDAMSGEHRADPLSLPKLPTSFLSAARSGKKPADVGEAVAH